MDDDTDVVELSGGEIVLWTDDGRSIQIKAVSPYGDPVELTAPEARELAEVLLKLAAAVE